MNWISKFEEEDKRKVEAERQRHNQESTARHNESTRFESVVKSLVPVLEKQRAELAQRLGFHLGLSVGDIAITVSAPRPAGSIRKSAFPFSFTLSDYNGDSLLIVAEDDGIIDRAGEPPDDMSYGDYYGREERVVCVRASLEDLLATDLDLLVEWLVACYRSNGRANAPRLKASDRQEIQSKALAIQSRNWKITAALSLVLGCLGLFLPVGPFALVWGLVIRRHLKKANQTDGRLAAAWAVGLGALGTISLMARIVLSTSLTPR